MKPADLESGTSLSLLHRACSHDQVAWARIWELYYPLIYAQCRTAGIPAVDVEDVSQNVLTSVHLGLAEFRKTEANHTFRGWLYTITRNEIVNFFRAQAKSPGARGGTDHLKLIDQIPDEAPSDSSVNQAGIDPVLKRALEMLRGEFDERTWEIYVRFKIDNVPAKEVADEFGITSGNVRLIAFRVKKRLVADFARLVQYPE